jgi:hypothetical protein
MDIKLLANVLSFIRPNSEFTLDSNGLTWLDKKQTEPNEAEIQAGLVAYQAAQVAAQTQTAQARAALLERLGITADEAALLLG